MIALERLFFARLLLSALAVSGCGVVEGTQPTPTPSILDGGGQVQTAHCRVTNEGFDVSYALAFANVCEAAYKGYRDIFGLDVLALNGTDAIEVHLVRQTQRHRPSMDAYGGVITFRGEEAHLLAPVDGGANNIYGICHEIGHLAFPIRDLHYFEAWADYAASYQIIPYVWERLGAAAWPQTYDYLANDGPGDIQRRIEAAAGGDSHMYQAHYQAVSVLIAVDNAYGPQTIGQAIRQMEAPLTLDALQAALVEVTDDEAILELFATGPGSQ